ncbi:MAG: M28 family peptidase, partial [Anaerolineaceae bacterium]
MPEPTFATPAALNVEKISQLVSAESLLAYTDDLTSIQPYSGWRSGGSLGETEALDYLESRLNSFSALLENGLALERQSFSIYMNTEFWDSSLIVTVNQQPYTIPAEGLRGSRHYRRTTSYFDSDGIIGDTNSNPLTAEGDLLVILDPHQLETTGRDEAEGKILFIDYTLLDTYVNPQAVENIGLFLTLVDEGLAGVVFVTQYSNSPRISRGSQMAEGIDFTFTVPSNHVPFLFVRIEDLSAAGVADCEQLIEIEKANLRLDTDVLSPGVSGNLAARIPGMDQSRAIILSAHIDSPNTPGAFDDGSGSAALLEIARVFDVVGQKPPVDVYLVWYGSHELCTCGSAHFASTHQSLLDRTLAVVNMDGLGYPLDIRPSTVTVAATTYRRFGEEEFPLFDFLSETAALQGLELETYVIDSQIGDNSNYDAFNVPNVNLYYLNTREIEVMGWTYMHYGNHWHDPYETADLV